MMPLLKGYHLFIIVHENTDVKLGIYRDPLNFSDCYVFNAAEYGNWKE